ncbi:MAG: DNA gyrase subunit A [Magnetococcales bacterium]|nr:DNA gyrase subunit A [Magnetococcales bacterium]|tara:strand:- start:328538 stop:331195 length:2658 start_codon:yes stop_codon:yes gene_type:complete
MSEVLQSISNITIEEEMKRSYLDYAMSVIVSRALPDARDGLKPVHRRVLYAMRVLGNEYNRPYKKSARVVGDVIGKYHPHGDSAVYMTIVRMAQDFSMRLELVDGQGNFGSMDGDAPAAMRYTEVRMARSASYMLQDLDKDTVDFRPNYDGEDVEPSVLPARIPNLLVNGSSGIAVGMATNIPPHNLGEIVDGALMMIDNPSVEAEELLHVVKGPDFPTGGIVMGRGGIKSALLTGRGSVIMRGRTHFEENGNKRAIIITEIPYQVNKAKMVEKIADLVRDKIITGISDLRDESDRSGVRVVVELKRDADQDVLLNQLFQHTQLQDSFSYNMLALDGGRPKLMGVKQLLSCFLKHREDVIVRRTKYELNKARTRAHVLVGLAIAVANIDDIIKLIRNAPNPAEAKAGLMDRDWPAENVRPLIELLGEPFSGTTYKMSEAQAQAILELRLHRLTGLERDKINDEANEISAFIKGLVDILSNREVLLGIMKDELNEVKELFATPRKSDIEDAPGEFNLEDFIKPEEMVVTISDGGYAKRQPLADYRAQRRGGKGRSVTSMKDDEQLETLFVANTHQPLLVFTSNGQVFKMKVFEIPQASHGSRGKAFINLVNLEKDERVLRVLACPREQEEWDKMVALFATRNGLIRKTPLNAFSNVHSGGIRGINLQDGDELVNVALTGEEDGDVLISTRNGQAVRFPVADMRTIASRTAYGVKGVTLRDDDKLVSMDVVTEEEPLILTVTENGYGKCTPQEQFPQRSRGTIGVIAIKTSERNGPVVASMPVGAEDHVIFVTSEGQVIRTRVEDISTIGRNTQGVRLFRVDKEVVATAVRIPADVLSEDDEDEVTAVDEQATDEMKAEAADAQDAPEETVDAETSDDEAEEAKSEE